MMASQHILALIPIEGIGVAEERVEGNGPVKGATMSFQKKNLNSPMVMIR